MPDLSTDTSLYRLPTLFVGFQCTSNYNYLKKTLLKCLDEELLEQKNLRKIITDADLHFTIFPIDFLQRPLTRQEDATDYPWMINLYHHTDLQPRQSEQQRYDVMTTVRNKGKVSSVRSPYMINNIPLLEQHIQELEQTRIFQTVLQEVEERELDYVLEIRHNEQQNTSNLGYEPKQIKEEFSYFLENVFFEKAKQDNKLIKNQVYMYNRTKGPYVSTR